MLKIILFIFIVLFIALCVALGNKMYDDKNTVKGKTYGKASFEEELSELEYKVAYYKK